MWEVVLVSFLVRRGRDEKAVVPSLACGSDVIIIDRRTTLTSNK